MSKIIRKEKDDLIITTYKSSDIKSSEYNKDTKELKLFFVKENKKYKYKNVDIKDYQNFENSTSQGSGFKTYISKYKSEKF